MDAKPERLTELYSNVLVEKDHPVICFRGKLDKLAALILEAQLLGEERENPAFVNDLQEILEFVRNLLPVEYKGTLLGEYRLLGLSSGELREQSWYPERYFGRGHLVIHRSMGALSLRLNLLRTITRETELTAVTALRMPEHAGPAARRWEDIVEALNRLSSLFYILMYKYLPC